MFCSNCGGIIEEGSKFCAKCGTAVNTATIPYTPPPAGAFCGVTPEPPKTAEWPKGKSKLLRIAWIIPLAIWLLWLVSVILGYYKKVYDKSMLGAVIGISVLIAIPILLTVIGGKKNKRGMILSAGIVYIFSGIGIPSAIMCFIAYAKMKKSETK